VFVNKNITKVNKRLHYDILHDDIRWYWEITHDIIHDYKWFFKPSKIKGLSVYLIYLSLVLIFAFVRTE